MPLPTVVAPAGVELPMDWDMLLLWTVLSLCSVGVVFAYKQALWAKRVNPVSASLPLLGATHALGLIWLLISVVLCLHPDLTPLIYVVVLFWLISSLLATIFQISMVRTIRAVARHNGVALRVRTIWGLLFGIFYNQHCIRAIEAHCGAVQLP